MSETRLKRPKPCESCCAKCGGDDVVRELKQPGEYLHNDGSGVLRRTRWIGEPWVESQLPHTAFRYVRECIEHHCRTCHYEWATKPLA